MPVCYSDVYSPLTEGLFGHLPAFKRDPLGFLTDCARNYGGVVPLRMLHKPVFLLLDPADIERVLTIGVHGPEKLIIVFVDDMAGVN